MDTHILPHAADASNRAADSSLRVPQDVLVRLIGSLECSSEQPLAAALERWTAHHCCRGSKNTQKLDAA